jgi:hypothetical protein
VKKLNGATGLGGYVGGAGREQHEKSGEHIGKNVFPVIRLPEENINVFKSTYFQHPG